MCSTSELEARGFSSTARSAEGLPDEGQTSQFFPFLVLLWRL